MIELDSADAVAAWLATPHRPAAAVRGVDVRGLPGLDVGDESLAGCWFLACEMTPAQAGHVTVAGATVVRDDPSRPYTTNRRELYSPAELFAGFDPSDPDAYLATFDAKVYAHWVATGGQNPRDLGESIARRLHDGSITDALAVTLARTRPAAIMGGHGLERSDPHYREVALIARALARAGVTVLSGGGPGAMEAAHFGAHMATRTDDELQAALAVLGRRPVGAEAAREYADHDWLHRAIEVTKRWPMGADTPQSVGIPTWAYGHEPPTAFATYHAKYFANSVREDGLLAVATQGVIFTPGSAGTIQEIFQDAAQNHYDSFGPPSPMVLFGSDYWTTRYPAWPLLRSLAARHDYESLVTLTDDPDAAVAAITSYRR